METQKDLLIYNTNDGQILENFFEAIEPNYPFESFNNWINNDKKDINEVPSFDENYNTEEYICELKNYFEELQEKYTKIYIYNITIPKHKEIKISFLKLENNIVFVNTKFNNIDYGNKNDRLLLTKKEFINTEFNTLGKINFNEVKFLNSKYNNRIESCQFTKCEFKKVEFFKCSFKDVEFNECEFKNVKFDVCFFENVIFDECLFTNITFTNNKYIEGENDFGLLFKNIKFGSDEIRDDKLEIIYDPEEKQLCKQLGKRQEEKQLPVSREKSPLNDYQKEELRKKELYLKEYISCKKKKINDKTPFEITDFRGINLVNQDLSGLNLTLIDLTNAKLQGAKLNNANLTFASLTNADLKGADLTRANLKGADLTNADLTNADLTNADLKDADLTNADLKHTNLKGADLTNADLKDTNLIGADLTRVISVGIKNKPKSLPYKYIIGNVIIKEEIIGGNRYKLHKSRKTGRSVHKSRKPGRSVKKSRKPGSSVHKSRKSRRVVRKPKRKSRK